MTKKQAEKKIEEAKALVQKLKSAKKARAVALEAGDMPVGSDLSVWIDRAIAWLNAILGTEGEIPHMLIHIAREQIIPALMDIAPFWGDAILKLLDMALAKLDEKYHPTT